MESTRPTLAAYTAWLKKEKRLTDHVRASLDIAHEIRQNYRTIFYIAGALTGVKPALKERYIALRSLIIEYPSLFGYAPHLYGTDPIAHPDPTPQEVRDIDYLFSAVIPDYQFVFLQPVALGIAAEAAWGEAAGIPSIFLTEKDAPVSRLIRGLTNRVETIEYADFVVDGIAQIRSYLQELSE